MKNTLISIMVLLSFSGLPGCREKDPSAWSSSKLDKWFEKGEWLNGWHIKPDASVNRRELAVSYFRHRERWDKAFAFLRDNDPASMELKRYDLDGKNLYATVSEYVSKDDSAALYEAHREYIDIQYVVSGRELIGIAPLNDVREIIVPYDEENDIEFMTVNQIKNLTATPGRFFLFFPSDVHRPGLKDGENAAVRKVVVKVKIN
ncbi:MAG TPA: YhcH/YjgK/YiaL family protein [Bacteroidales bacterium]|jgi:YhcH/YjgK/YiaL family protein|nr:YhcH/YjgK/YiaL family protein [Bacteroidales bacterium]HOS71104.1 YhcH/YjgK/YiaL family protein [Bacteroidales bacterium]HQH23597.1 YhcH/YjgK/YiaL family protein [Bacteroidales bacterium]HQJ81119.1 YhcH/YjgK/YiaL family protein [Bacteroidales bacterium]